MKKMILNEIEPKEVFKYFEEISGIPHGSSNTKKISDYCVEFAKKNGLRYIQDKKNNIIIFKDGTLGYEKSKPVIIQGHLDMVCEKNSNLNIDMENQGLELMVEGDMIKAVGTTLGGDDGIAVAYGLAILASKDIPHPPLEVIFTVDEEIGMLGAAFIDCSELKSNIMLNIDSEEEGILLVSCAGGVTVTCNIPIERKSSKGKVISIIVTGLQGGHSGVEIDKGRANSNQLMGRILEEMSEDIEFNIIDINGGKKDNAIPKETVARIMISDKDVEKAYSIIEDCERVFKEEYLENDKDITILKQESFDNAMIMSDNCTTKVIQALLKLPEGVIKMSEDIQGLVQTSLNMGILVTKENMVTMSFSVRSSVGEEKEILVNQIKNIIEDLGGNIECTGNYPAWEYKKDSDLRRLMVDIYREQTGKEAEVQAIHAGVECGLFAGKISNLDCVSFGPDIFDIHTTKERLSISSVERTWKYLLEILRSLR
jgi:dipeptidase D